MRIRNSGANIGRRTPSAALAFAVYYIVLFTAAQPQKCNGTQQMPVT